MAIFSLQFALIFIRISVNLSFLPNLLTTRGLRVFKIKVPAGPSWKISSAMLCFVEINNITKTRQIFYQCVAKFFLQKKTVKSEVSQLRLL